MNQKIKWTSGVTAAALFTLLFVGPAPAAVTHHHHRLTHHAAATRHGTHHHGTKGAGHGHHTVRGKTKTSGHSVHHHRSTRASSGTPRLHTTLCQSVTIHHHQVQKCR